MKVSVNGNIMDIEDNTSVFKLLKDKKIDSNTVVVEINLDIVDRDNYNTHIIKPNDSIEILRFVGGG